MRNKLDYVDAVADQDDLAHGRSQGIFDQVPSTRHGKSRMGGNVEHVPKVVTNGIHGPRRIVLQAVEHDLIHRQRDLRVPGDRSPAVGILIVKHIHGITDRGDIGLGDIHAVGTTIRAIRVADPFLNAVP